MPNSNGDENDSLFLCPKGVIMEDINRIKLVLVGLSEQMGVNPSIVSKWCTNTSQPGITSLLKIADLLEVDIKELIVREYKAYLLSQTWPKTARTLCSQTAFIFAKILRYADK